ncbi:hypothetical protein, partial [Saccharopolyspora cebuensis]|uniref:hypothetical protein n=1 Tax=Saccharopolyspora cebuensis TaxID=418759 RepID=UPI0031F17585
MQDVGFNHPQKYQQITGGRGTAAIEPVIDAWQNNISKKFNEVASKLEEANSKAGVAWEGQAAQEHGGSLAPMTQFIHDADTMSQAVSRTAMQQADNFSTVKNSMPEPVEVSATDSWVEKGGAWLVGGETDLQQQEREATEKAQEAKRHYDNYQQSSEASVNSLPTFPAPPRMAYEQGAEPGGQGTAVGTPTSPGNGGSAQGIGGGGGSIGRVGGGGGLGPDGLGSVSPGPAGSESQWAGGGGGGSNPLPGYNPSVPPGGGPGGPGGIGVVPPGTTPPGTGRGGGPGAGGRAGGAGGAGGRGLGAGGGKGAGGGGVGGAGAGGVG